jgi:YVTN family beta-propeller protein
MKAVARNKLIPVLAIMAVFSLNLLPGARAENSKSGYRLLKKFPVGGKGGWDLLTLDSNAHRLYISHADRAIIMDTKSGGILGTITGTDGIHGIGVVPGLNRGFTTNGKTDNSSEFDLKTFKTISLIKTGKKPDTVIYDDFSKRIITFNGNSNDATLIDPATGKVTGTIPLGGAPEFAVSDSLGNIFVNLEDTSETLKVDVKAMKVKERWKLGKGEEPSGLAMDKKNRILFIGCQNKYMVIMNADNGKILDTLPIGDGVDATAFDETTGLAFSSNREGSLDVIHEDSPVKFKAVERIKTMYGSKTMALDPKTHHIFIGAAKFGKPPAATKERPHPRPQVIPSSFMILEYGRI